MIRAIRAFRLALAFLTIVPVPMAEGEVTSEGIADARLAYPVVGALIGLALAALSEFLRWLGAPLGPSAFLLVAASALVSGGLHLDGLADTADGMFLWGDTDRRLSVMRDPRVGSFGVVVLVLALLGKFAALGEMGGPRRSLALLGAATVGRTLVLVSAGLARYARPDGTGRILVDAAGWRAAVGSAVGLMLLGGVLAGRVGLAASLVAVGITLRLTRMARSQLGGVTGDTLGATVELGELAFLIVLAVGLAH